MSIVLLVALFVNAVLAVPAPQRFLEFPFSFPGLNQTFNGSLPFFSRQIATQIPCYAVSGSFKKFNKDAFTYVDTSVFWLLQSPALSIQCIQQKVNENTSAILGCAVQVSDGDSTGLFFIYQKGGYYVAVDAPALKKLDYMIAGNTHAFKHCDGAMITFTRKTTSLDVVVLVGSNYDPLTNGLCGSYQGGNGYHFTPKGYEVVRIQDWAPTWSLAKDDAVFNQFFNTSAVISPASYQRMQYLPPNVKAGLITFPGKQKEICAATPSVIKLSNMIMLPETQNLKALLPKTENAEVKSNPGYYPGVEQIFDTSSE